MALIALGGAVGLSNPRAGAVLAGLGLASAAVAGGLVAPRVPREEARLSVALGSLAAASGGAYYLARAAVGVEPGIPVALALGLTASFPVPLIHAVTLHSLPSTFRDKPSKPAALAGGLVSALTPAAFLASDRAGSALLAALLAIYIVSARLYRVPAYLGVAREFRSPKARAGALFFAYSHAASLAYTLVTAAAAIAHAAGVLGGLDVLHVLAAGFTALHVYIHVPMMLPTILALPAAGRFDLALASVLLAAASGLAWPASRTASLASAALAFTLSPVASFRLKPRRSIAARSGGGGL